MDSRDVPRPSQVTGGPDRQAVLGATQPVDLAPGDCVALGDGGTAGPAVVACADPHDFQVTASERHPAGSDAARPTDEDWARYRTERCDPAAEAFLGHAVGASRRVYPTLAAPTAERWAAGDRSVVCGVAWDEDGDGIAGSYRGDVRDLVTA